MGLSLGRPYLRAAASCLRRALCARPAGQPAGRLVRCRPGKGAISLKGRKQRTAVTVGDRGDAGARDGRMLGAGASTRPALERCERDAMALCLAGPGPQVPTPVPLPACPVMAQLIGC